ncbi:MAG: putative porin [Chthoniobacter sp.]|nr:putative porin [Chthoniobacter sp.]
MRILSTSICASAVVRLCAATPGDVAGPLPAGGANRPLFAANSVPPITGDPEPEQVLPAPALVAKTDAAAMPKAGGRAAKEEPSLAKAAPSESVTINLINRLVERGVLTKEDAAGLIQQAEADAVAARAQTEVTQQIVNSVAPLLAIPQQVPPTADIAPYSGQSAVRVTYIPESVKAQMRDQIKTEVMAQARNERWADPRTVPEWTTRIRLFGDVRTRYEGIYFPGKNDNTGAFPNFNAINTGAPFDVSGTVFSPQLNVDQDRSRVRLRVRLGADVDLREGFTAGVRLATGDSNSPVSPNQSLGGSGGNFSKYAVWLDRGFLRYQYSPGAAAEPAPASAPEGKNGKSGKELAAPKDPAVPRDRKLVISLGRFENPFYTPSDIVWDEDLGFDGIAGTARYEVVSCVTPFLTVGAFPYFNTDLNFSSNRPDKFSSTDKWLYAGQLGLDWKPHQDFKVKIAGAYYVFDRVAGKLSTPYTPLNAQDAGDTDNTRPAFAQKGNTYRALRNIVPTADNNFGTTNQFQYFGLASPFRVLSITGQIDYSRYEPFHVTAYGEYAQNLAWDRAAVGENAINNRGPNTIAGAAGLYEGGNTAWIAGLRVGHPLLAKRGDWSVGFNYRYVESDAVVDGFADSDFGGGGTNVQGYTFTGSFALGERVALGLRWMSANEIAGPPLKADTLQVDVSGKF